MNQLGIRRLMLGMVTLLLALSPLSNQPAAQAKTENLRRVLTTPTPAPGEIVPGALIVKVRPSFALRTQITTQPTAAFARLANVPGLRAEAVSGDTWTLETGAQTDVLALVAQLNRNPDVVYAEPVYRRYATGVLQRAPNDPFAARQWALNRIGAPQAWDISTGRPEVIVAVIDTGINRNHEDLAGRVTEGYNFVNNTSNAMDDQSHGTFGAGVIAAAGDNGLGVAGMCWQCKVMPIKVLNSQGAGRTDWAARGVRWAVDRGAKVINMSLGGLGASQAEHDAIKYAVSKGAIVIAAAGNEAADGNPIEYPAAFEEVTAVGATDINDARAFFSNFGSYLDLSAPGVNIVSTGADDNLNGYGTESGTSFSAPYVSGLVALVWSVNPGLSDREVMRIIAQTADDLGAAGPDDYYGFGRINAARALQQAQSIGAPAPPAPPATGENVTFPETGRTLKDTFLSYWRANGGLPVFGYPVSEQQVETAAEGTYWVQYFERNRLEYHPENQPPYNVLLGRLGDTILKKQGRDWQTFPKGVPGGAGCRFFSETQHSVCGTFLRYWNEHGLSDPKLDAYGRSLQLWGLPLSEPTLETNSSGDTVLTQWFERGRFEDHGTKGILLGLLGNELLRNPAPAPPAPAPPAPAPAPSACDGIPPPVSATIQPSNCLRNGMLATMSIFGFQPNEQLGFWLTAPDGAVAGTVQTVGIGPTGSADGVPFDVAGLAPGLWFWVFQGTSSGHKAVVYFRVLP